MQLNSRNTQSSLNNYSYTNPNDRSLTTQGIDGASPQKFRHMSRKLFVDRKEILGVFGQEPGRYHGYHKDKTVGGTYKPSESKFWRDKNKPEENIVAGARVPGKRDFQTKKKIPEISSSNIFSLPQPSIGGGTVEYIKKSPDVRTRLLQQKVMKDLNHLKREDKLPYLRESASNPILGSVTNSPYKASRNDIDFSKGDNMRLGGKSRKLNFSMD